MVDSAVEVEVVELWYIWDNMYNIFNDAFWGLPMIGLSPMTRMQKCMECKFNFLRNTLNCGDIALGTYYFERFFTWFYAGEPIFMGDFVPSKGRPYDWKSTIFGQVLGFLWKNLKETRNFGRKWEKNSQTKHGKVNKTYQYLLKKTLYPIYESHGLKFASAIEGVIFGRRVGMIVLLVTQIGSITFVNKSK